MRSYLTPAGRKRVHAARLAELVAHYEHQGPTLLSDGTDGLRVRSAMDAFRARALFLEWRALRRDIDEEH